MSGNLPPLSLAAAPPEREDDTATRRGDADETPDSTRGSASGPERPACPGRRRSHHSRPWLQEIATGLALRRLDSDGRVVVSESLVWLAEPRLRRRGARAARLRLVR